MTGSHSSMRVELSRAQSADQIGNGNISQPSTSAAAIIPPNIFAPMTSCSCVSSRSSAGEHRRDAQREDQHEHEMALPSFAPLRDIERVDDDERVQQARDDEKGVAVLVGDGNRRCRRRIPSRAPRYTAGRCPCSRAPRARRAAARIRREKFALRGTAPARTSREARRER